MQAVNRQRASPAVLHETALKYACKRTPGDQGRVYRHRRHTDHVGAIDGGSIHGDGTVAGSRDRRGADHRTSGGMVRSYCPDVAG